MYMENQNTICPVCGEGNLAQKELSEIVEYNGSSVEVDGFLCSVCDSCGTEVSSPEQSRHNKRLVLDTRREIDGLLKGEKIRAIRQKYQITQQQAASIFGGGAVAFSKYEKGDVVQSTPMDRLLRVADSIPEAFCWLAKYAGVPIKVKKENLSFVESRGIYAAQYAEIPINRAHKPANHNIENIIITEEEEYETESVISEPLSVA